MVIPGKQTSKKFIHLVIYHLAIGLLSLMTPYRVGAYVYNQGQPTPQVIVDKKLRLSGGQWQDNLPSNERVLREGDLIDFQIRVKNSGSEDLSEVELVDQLPRYLKIIFAPANVEQGQVRWQVTGLKAGEEKTFQLRGQIEPASDQQGTFCLANKVEVRLEGETKDADTASYCVAALSELPQAGAPDLLWQTGALTLAAAAGLFLRRLARGA